jgi:hypothetical protein
MRERRSHDEVILPLMRNCFFGGALHAVLLLQKGHAEQLAADIAEFIREERNSRVPRGRLIESSFSKNGSPPASLQLERTTIGIGKMAS